MEKWNNFRDGIVSMLRFISKIDRVAVHCKVIIIKLFKVRYQFALTLLLFTLFSNLKF